ncbi:hypothetical protein AJ88_43765 [Mesorhizobium amorphae CCBAU 01583]|nr:hypothetical protein AJ88_43765 [Mesorhizobium amorphae CCBAU 01583]
MVKRTQSTGASSATDIAKLLAQAGPARDLTKLLTDVKASGDAFRNAGRALSRHNDTMKNSLNAGEIAKVLSQIPSTQDLAKHISDINASSEALKTASKDLSRRNEAIRNSLTRRGPPTHFPASVLWRT